MLLQGRANGRPKTAVRLVQGLTLDLPHPGERREVATLHFEAIEALENYVEGLRVSNVVTKWLGAVER
jgi:hypothetical protein